MSHYFESLIATASDPFTMAVAVLLAVLAIMIVAATAVSYFAVSKLVSVVGTPTAKRLRELVPGNILWTQSREEDRMIVVREVHPEKLNGLDLDGGYIVTNENKKIEVPQSMLILVS